MKALALIHAECANYQPNGSCLGANISESCRITSFTPRDRCLVGQHKRCDYFEYAVCQRPATASDPKRVAILAEALAEYRATCGLRSERTTPCPDCGNQRGYRMRLCPACQGKHRRDTFRRASRKARKPANS